MTYERFFGFKKSLFLILAMLVMMGGFGATYADRLPIHFKKTPCEIYERVRQVGEDNHEVLKDWLGMPDTEIDQAEEAGFLS